MLDTFSHINELHLHGGTNETSDAADGDQNVFDIAQAVAIHLYVMDGTTGNNSISYSEMWGRRESKYELLSIGSADTIPSEIIHPDIDNCTFSPQSELGGIYTIRLGEAFDKYGGGIKTNRDDIAIGFTQVECFNSAQAFLSESANIANSSLIENILYRPFDLRYIYYDEKVVKSRSLPTMQHLIGHSNIGLLASSSWTSPERFSVNISDKIVEMKSGTHDRGTTLFPLYRFEHILNGPAHRVSNFTPAFSDRWFSLTGQKIVLDSNNRDRNTDCESVFYYIYALCYASSYRSAFRSAIAQGFPLVCFPGSDAVFHDISAIGQELGALHRLDSLGAPVLADPKNRFVAGSEARVGAMTTDVRRTSAGRVYINDQCWFETVTEGAWSQWMGGYQPAQKWLKDRSARGGQKVGPGRVLTPEDQLHYRRMIVALSRTAELTAELDQVIVRHGGWPAAFKGMTE
jgi:predicted helicase